MNARSKWINNLDHTHRTRFRTSRTNLLLSDLVSHDRPFRASLERVQLRDSLVKGCGLYQSMGHSLRHNRCVRFTGVNSLAQSADVLEINQSKSGSEDDGEGAVPGRRLGFAGHGLGQGRGLFPSEVLAMRDAIVSTLTQVVEIGIFAAAAGALAVGMMHVR